MLPKNTRFDRTSFARTLRAGRRIHTPLLSLVHVTTPDFRVAAVVSKKVAKRAVVRNQLRRRLYVAITRLAPPHGHYILIAKPGATELSYTELEVALARALAAAVGVSRTTR